jgi:hypothetical protein
MERLLGVRYRHAEKTVAPVPASAGSANLSSLPVALRKELCQAAELLDTKATKQTIKRIREIDEPLAEYLEELIRSYRFDQISVLCDGP